MASHFRLALCAALALAGAGQAAPRSAAAAGGTAATSWAGFRDRFVDGWYRINPGEGVYEGRHDLDGRLPDWSEEGLKRQADYLRAGIARAQAWPAARLGSQDRFERDYFIAVMRGKLFWLTDADQPHRNPAWYVSAGFDPNVYLARPYGTPERRMRAVIAMFGHVPAAAAQIRANLRRPLPVSFVDYGVAAFGGFADFYAHDAKQAFGDVRDPALNAQFDAAAAPAAQAMRALADWLKAQRATATTDFALGPERFSRMLDATEDVRIPLDRLEAAGRADLARNQAALKAACARFAPGQSVEACAVKMENDKPAAGPVEAAREQIPMLRQFVVAHQLLTIPGTEQALVHEAPAYNRQNSAYIDPPGPYDKGLPSVYYIAPPDPAWSAQVQRDFIPGKADLLFTTVHEVMPGHFVQFLHANRSPSLFGQLFVGYAFAEGWAHYAEQMMWDAGLGQGDAETHIGQLTNALLRDCRFLSAIGMHARGMTQEQSYRMFREQCFQDEGNARQQAARGTYDPAYLNYTMGKLMIMRLRADWTARHGGRAGWKAFHDAFLSYGGPPIPLVRQAMMGEPTAQAVF